MKFLRFLLPNVTPKGVALLGDLFIIRERILHTIMLFASAMALVGFCVILPLSFRRGSFTSFFLISGILALFLLLTLGRNLSYKVRAFILLGSLYALGFYTISFSGLAGNGILIMISIPIFAGILMGLQAGIVSLVLSTLTIIGFGYGMTHGMVKAPEPEVYGNSNSTTNWISAIVYFVLLAVMATISLVAFINNLQSSITRQKELSKEIDKERQNLEISVTQRTQDLDRRLHQLRSAAEISRSISSMLNLDDLLQQVVDLIRTRFDLYYVGAFLIDDTGKYAVLKAATGTAGEIMLSRRHLLPVAGASMIGWATANQKPRIALDVGDEAVRFNNPLLPNTRSEMALPILSHGISLGALTVQSEKSNAFDQDDILVLQGVADSLAVAIENSNMFTTTQRNLDEIRSLNKQYLQQAWLETVGINGELGYTYSTSAPHAETATSGTIRVPLTIRNQVIGEITLELDRESLSDQNQTIVDSISTQTAQALENARLLEDVRRKALQEEKLNSMTSDFSQASSVEEILRSAIFSLGQIPNVAEISLHLSPPEEAVSTTSQRPNQRKNGNGHHPQEGSK